ncbi:hypothetical protein EMIT0180MI3_370007 [Priestia megaterium]|jgi:hypothetical protein
MVLDSRVKIKYADMSPNEAVNAVIATFYRFNVSQRDTQKTVTYHTP